MFKNGQKWTKMVKKCKKIQFLRVNISKTKPHMRKNFGDLKVLKLSKESIFEHQKSPKPFLPIKTAKS